ncbi:hypothetical protein K474DRAFT_1680627 [Panus rudis PR-1116 ss-1]|nr:hypothetical protein K474DRAFT_1680627 [Panus rudis PR-1116 ss-1]
MIPSASAILLLAAALPYTTAQTSLFIPGFDPQPLSVSQVGAGSDGKTTFAIVPGTPSGTLQDIGLIGTATLIVSPSQAEVIYDAGVVSLTENCAINGDTADCSVVGVADGTTTTFVTTETITPFEVQGAGGDSVPASVTPAPTSSGTGASSTQASGFSTTISQSSSSSSNTGSVAASPTSADTNGASFSSISPCILGLISVFALWSLN